MLRCSAGHGHRHADIEQRALAAEVAIERGRDAIEFSEELDCRIFSVGHPVMTESVQQIERFSYGLGVPLPCCADQCVERFGDQAFAGYLRHGLQAISELGRAARVERAFSGVEPRARRHDVLCICQVGC